MNRKVGKWAKVGIAHFTAVTPGNSSPLQSGHEISGRERGKKEKDQPNTFLFLINEYRQVLELADRPAAKIFSNLKVFINFIEETGSDPLRLQVKHAEEFQAYLATAVNEKGELRYRTGSVTSLMGSVSSFYAYLKDRKAVLSNPFSAVTRLRQEKQLPKNIPDEEAMEKILTYFRNFHKGKDLVERRKRYRAHVLAEVMYSTGCRIHEAAGMKTEEVDFIRGTVMIHDSKTKSIRQGILGEYALKVLQHYVFTMREFVLFGKNGADMDLLFGTKKNLHITFNAMLKEACRKVHVPVITSHGIRHSVGFHLLKNGCDIRYIQEILGHKVLNSTQVYTRVDREDLSKIIDLHHPRRLDTRRRAS